MLLAASAPIVPDPPRGASSASADAGLSLPPVPPGVLHENFHIALLAGQAAKLWPVPSGSVLSIGTAGAALRVTFACEPCAKGAAAAGVPLVDLSRAWQRHAQRGLLATVLRTGSVREGDDVRLLAGEKYDSISSNPHLTPLTKRHVR